MTSASNEVSFPAPVEVVVWEEAGSFSVDSGTAALIPAAQAGQVSASSDPRSFFDDLVACLDASGSSELTVADGVSELEFWGRRPAALCLVRPAA